MSNYPLDLSETKNRLRRNYRKQHNLDKGKAVWGDAFGVIADPNRPGKVFVRVKTSNGLSVARSVWAPRIPFGVKMGDPVRLKYDDGRLMVDGPDHAAMLSVGTDPVARQQQYDSPSTPQINFETLNLVAKSGYFVSLKGWNIIANGLYHEVSYPDIDLEPHLPASGEMCYAAIFVLDDFTDVEVITSTARGVYDDPLGPQDVQECLNSATSGSTPVRAVMLTGDMTGITQADITQDSVDLRQLVNAADTVQATTSDSGTVANTASETTVLGTVAGSTTLGADSLSVGRTLRIQAWGIVSDTGTPTLTLKIKLGSTVILTTGAITLASGITNKLWRLEGVITVRSIGASGTVFGQGQFNYNGGTFTDIANTATTTVDTTTDQIIDITATWSAASSSNTISCTNCIIEVLN